MSASSKSRAVGAAWDDAWLLDGVRTPFADYNSPLAAVSMTDLGIKAARAVLDRAGTSADDVGTVITGNMTQSSFDAYMLPRHVGLYSGVPIEVLAHMVQRVCGTGIEVLMQGADAVTRRDAGVALCVGTESMSHNPVASYTHRSGFRLGQVEFKDFRGRRCSTRRMGARWAIPRRSLPGATRSRGARWTNSPPAASIMRWRPGSIWMAKSCRSIAKHFRARVMLIAGLRCGARRGA
jgi:hypothetical protein